MLPHNSTLFVYCVDLYSSRFDNDRHARCLSSNDHERVSRFRFDRDRLRWSCSRAALRTILGHHLHLPAKEVELVSRADGKPVLGQASIARFRHHSGRLQAADTSSSPKFNVSHSKDRTVIVVSHALEVGCDVEHTGRIRDWPAVSRRFFSAAEQKQLAGVETHLKPHAFFLCWTRKEAVIKTTGEGLRADLRGFDVSLEPGAPARVTEERRKSESNDPWHLYNIPFDDDYVGAVAVRAPQPPQLALHSHWRFDEANGRNGSD